MGAYIPNMKKPKNAFDCSKKINPEERMCIYTGKVFEETLSLLLDRPCDDCQLIEVDDDIIRKFRESAVVINAIYKRLKEVIRNSPELKKELAGKNPNLVIIDEANAIQDVESIGQRRNHE